MVYSFVFLGERNRRKVLEELTSKVGLPSPSYQVVFLTNKNVEKENLSNEFRHTNFKTIVYKESSTPEQMFESLVHSENLGTVVLFKESAKNINFSDVDRMIEKNSRGAKVVVSRQNKSENWLTKSWETIKSFFTKIFFGLKLYPGEADIILLDSILVSTLSEMTGKSALLSKVNGWAGVEPKIVTIPLQEKTKQKKSKRCFLFPSVWAGIFVAMLVGLILFVTLNVNLTFLGWFSYVVGMVAFFGISVYTFSRALFNYHFGEISFTTQAEAVQIIDNFDE